MAEQATASHRFDPTILREYDVRGVIGSTLHAADAQALGRAFGTIVAEKGGRRVAVGRDGRISSPEIAAATIAGLRAAGIDVLDVGGCPTPALYFAVHHLGTDGGIMITGSHNPPDYNGFKMMLGTAPFFGADIQRLGEIAGTGGFAAGQGSVEAAPVLEAYVARLLQDHRAGRDLSVVWDCGNGATGPVVTALTEVLPGTHTVLYPEVDGTFPNHHPDPTVPETLEGLRAAVEAAGADLGIAFDGDGDRIGVIDETGRVIWGDQLLAIYATEILADAPGATVIADVKASQVLFDRVAELGGVPLMWRTGHSLIKTKMAETGAPLAGEMSGHLFFKDRYYGFDDALYAAVRLLALVAGSDRPVSAWRDDLPTVLNTPEIRFPCAEERKFGAVAEVKAALAGRRDVSVNDIDGVRVSSDDGWWLLRASNTQDVLVARCEAQSPEALDRLKEQVRGAVRAVGLDVPDF
ncbi:phosphomannomutase/phosphoglucomutase [Thalassobaculum sp. OXR-137]|uniref:phosphoglucomutase/phosphomannomutase PgmG n=1 Tax=Thalassobaculum sp. OXR-137 TaxID=3100173 RepID=UPI002AC9315C|nr:phosphomannomutase/phosphoglucomutase [Thalassobaculum sp. OXR-137]WPZ36656.1 phosphomannomutase/phosphoglucomutase [Thalassobaculum sp. OXR-137]